MKLGLQIYLGTMSLIVFLYGALQYYYGVQLGADPNLPPVVNAPADNQIRYSGGMFIGLSMMIWWIIPNIEKHTIPLRIICITFLLSGLGRLISLILVGPAMQVQIQAMVMEFTAPLLLIWQHYAAKEVLRQTQ